MIDRNKMAKNIRAGFASVKFWFLAWKKEKDAVLAAKIRIAIEDIKELISKVFELGVDVEDRDCLATMKKEISEVEAMVGKPAVVFAV